MREVDLENNHGFTIYLLEYIMWRLAFVHFRYTIIRPKDIGLMTIIFTFLGAVIIK